MAPPEQHIAASSLPAPRTRFIGREAELALAAQRMSESRLVTFVGPGGMGKTRLAIEAARAWIDTHPADAWFVDLSSASDSASIERTAALALGVRNDGSTRLAEQVAAYLMAGAGLIVLDNCEQVIEAAADFTEFILSATQDVRVLATSREPLGLAAEALLEVPPLGLADDALALFEDRARAIVPQFAVDPADEAAREICERLDGMPLAIELAAARTRALSLSEINARLEDRFALLSTGNRSLPERHRTLSAAVEWSYQLLSKHERMLYERLSVFSGGWTLSAAEAVCSGDGIERRAIIDLLSLLIDKSLVVADVHSGAARYRMLETLREHASSRLAERAKWQQRHFEWVASLAENTGPWLRRARELEWLNYVSGERENLRTALRWAVGRPEFREMGLSITVACLGLWWHRGLIAEGEYWLENFWPAPDGDPSAAIVRAWITKQALREAVGDFPAGHAAAEEAVAQARRLGEDASLALALCWLLEATAFPSAGLEPVGDLYEEASAAVERTGDQYLRALLACHASFAQKQLGRDLEEDLKLLRASGDLALTGVLLNACGELAREQGEMALARDRYREALEIRELIVGPGGGQTWLLRVNLSFIELMEGNSRAAVPLLQSALQNASENETLYGISASVMGTGVLAALEGELVTAARLLGAARRIDDSIGMEYNTPDLLVVERGVMLCHEGMGEEAFERERKAGGALETQTAIRLAAELLQRVADEAGHQPAGTGRPGGLSRQEVEVLRRLAAGGTNREIAAALFLSVRTVENHIANAYGKINARGRAEATAWAIAQGLVAAAPQATE